MLKIGYRYVHLDLIPCIKIGQFYKYFSQYVIFSDYGSQVKYMWVYTYMGNSQLRICRPPCFGEKFEIHSSYREKFIENLGDDVTKMTINSKNKNRKNLKLDFSFDSVDSGSFMHS